MVAVAIMDTARPRSMDMAVRPVAMVVVVMLMALLDRNLLGEFISYEIMMTCMQLF